MKKNLIVAGFCIMTFASSAQVTWYFGNHGGLKFNSAGTTSAVSCSSTSSEAFATLVDPSNNVMLYTNGNELRNGNHTVQNTTWPLLAHTSSTQGVLVVPIPSAITPGTGPTKAFIFTLSAAETCYGNGTGGAGLRVTMVTINGTAPSTSVTIASMATDYNMRLTPGLTTMGEKMACIADGRGGYWVVVHGVGPSSNMDDEPYFHREDESRFYAYHVGCLTTSIAALDATEVSSNITTVTAHKSHDHPGANTMSLAAANVEFNGQGQMKIAKTSPTMAKLATTLPWNGNLNYTVNPVGQVFDFNLVSGVVSNPIQFSLGFNATTGSTARDGLAYGVEFSPNGRYLYVSSTNGSAGFGTITSRIYQYDLLTWTASAIASSKVMVASLPASASATFGGLERGPDNKIYIARTGNLFVDVIPFPNTGGTGCGYSSGISIGGVSCLTTLPHTLIANELPVITASVPNPVCYGSPIDLCVNAIPGHGVSIDWAHLITGDNVSCTSVTPLANGTYSATVNTDGCLATATYNVTVESNNPDFSTTATLPYTGSPYFNITATPIVPPAYYVGFWWEVAEVDPITLADISGTKITNPSCWWSPSTYCTFDNYDYSVYYSTSTSMSCAGTTDGKFGWGKKYRITRGTWITPNCPWQSVTTYVEMGRSASGTPTLTLDKTGLYSDEAERFKIISSERIEFRNENPVIIYPNPVNGLLNIEAILFSKAEIFNSLGSKIMESSTVTIDVSSLTPGVYFINVHDANGKIEKLKFIKQ